MLTRIQEKHFSLNQILKFEFTKRQKIVSVSIILGLIFVFITQNANIFYKRDLLILFFGLISYLLSVWCISESLNKTKLITLFILPTLFCIGISSFYFVLRPEYIRWVTRIPFAIICSSIMYLILLSQNVFNISSQRTIPLHRAATTSSLTFTLITAILIFTVISTFRLNFFFNGALIFIFSFALIIQVLWTIQMDKLNTQILLYSFVLSLLVSELAVALSFWPMIQLLWGLSLASILYTMIGVTVNFLHSRLSRSEAIEYSIVGGLLFFLSLLFTLLNWSPIG